MGNKHLSGDWLLEGVCPGDSDCGERLVSDMSMFEQDGSDSSPGWPLLREASSTENLAEKVEASSRHFVALSRSMLCAVTRWCRTARRLGELEPQRRHVLSPLLPAGERCSF